MQSAMTLSQAIASKEATKTDQIIHAAKKRFSSNVNKMNNRHPVCIPGLRDGKSFYARSWSTSIKFGTSNCTAVVIGAPSEYSALETVQEACIERVRHETWLPEMMLAIGAIQLPSFVVQNNVGTDPRSRAYSVQRGAVEGVVALGNFPGWYQPEHGEVYGGSKRKVPTVIFDQVCITLGANNVGSASEIEQQHDESHLVPIGASVNAWKRATAKQQAEWRTGRYHPSIVAPRSEPVRIKRAHLWKCQFSPPPLSRKSVQGGMRKRVSRAPVHVENTSPGMLVSFW